MSEVQIARTVDGVGVVTIDRPAKKNALSIAVRNEISDAVENLVADESVRVIVITGQGDVFSAGFDLAEFAIPGEEHHRRLWDSSDRFHHVLLRCPLPVIAAVNGAALAGGFDLAVLADIRVAARSARFAHVEQVFGDVVYRPLRELIGGGLARELVLTGRSLDADEALEIGLVNRVVPDGSALDAALEMALLIARAPRQILLRTKAKIVAAAAIDPDLATLDL